MRRAGNLAAGGASMCALAALVAAPALYIPGLALLLAAAVAPTWVALSTARAAVELHPPLSTVVEGDSVPLTVTVSRGPIPFPGATLLPGPGEEVVALPPKGKGEVVIETAPLRRGRQTLGPVRLRVADPLAICARELRSAEHQLLVLPRVYPVTLPDAERAGGQRRAGMPSGSETSLEIDSLRSYQAGTPASRIHWPTVARTGSLMERGFTAESDPRVLVMLDAHRPESEETLDQALRATASLCVALARRDGCLLLLPEDRRPAVIAPDLLSWPALHARLALVSSGAGVNAARRPAAAGTVVYVTASAASMPAFRGRCLRVSPCPLAAVRVAFTVAGCSAQLLGASAQARSA